jgi:hypothetical protein
MINKFYVPGVFYQYCTFHRHDLHIRPIMSNTRGLYVFWENELHKVRVGEADVKSFEKRLTVEGVNLLGSLIGENVVYTSVMGIFGGSSYNPHFDDFEYAQPLIKQAMSDYPKTSPRGLIKTWFEDRMERSYFHATMCMNLIPFQGPCLDKGIFKQPSTVPTTFEGCFPSINEWATTLPVKKRKSMSPVSYLSPSSFDCVSPMNNDHNRRVIETGAPGAPKKWAPPYSNHESAYDSPHPSFFPQKPPRAPTKKKKNVIQKVSRVLLWGDAGGVDGYGGGL